MQRTKEIQIKSIMDILTPDIVQQIEKLSDYSNLQEIRIRIDKPLIFYLGSKEVVTNYIIKTQDIKFLIQRISNYSIYAFEEEIKQGYITIRGGHRVGLCGSCVVKNKSISTIKDIASVNIRICREIKGCSNKIMKFIIDDDDDTVKNTIIISPPKCGKTTLIRDIVRNLSMGINSASTAKKICVIDERSEIAGCFKGVPQMDIGIRTDVLDSAPKSEGILMAIRGLSPDIIVCDEIGTDKDIESVISALNSGVSVITTIHGYGIEDLYSREVFKNLLDNHVFKRAIVLSCKKGIGTIEYIYDFSKNKKIYGGN